MQKNTIIAVLAILIVILLGLLIYTYNTTTTNNQSNNSTTTTITTKSSSNDSKSEIKSINDYPTTNDNDIKTYYLEKLVSESNIDLNTNFKKTSFTTKNGIKYSLTCTNYLQDNSNNNSNEPTVNCDNIKINIEDYNTSFDYSPNDFGCGDASYILLTNNYLINQASSGCGAGGPITIYNKNGQKIFEEKYSEYIYNDIGQVKIKNNVLYYLTYSDWNSDKLYFTSYDLSTNEKNVIETINAHPAGGKN